jgi:uncharacterized protein (TIGR02757 family)
MRLRKPLNAQLLGARLDSLAETFDVTTIAPDPLQLVLRYDDPLDQETAGLIAAAFAYGRADIIVSNIGALLEKMTPSPYRYLASFDPREAAKRFAGFAHRFHKTPELVAFLTCIAGAIRKHGSLGTLFESCYDANDSDIGPTLARFVETLRNCEEIGFCVAPAALGRGAERGTTRLDVTRGARNGRPRAAVPTQKRALQYLLTSPKDGSACKRMNLYLRWMIRRTPPDLGIWSFADPRKLVMPLDTHIHRIATFLGLNDRKSFDWKTARALTDRLARLDGADPVRYDFALCRLGILDLCSRKRRKENCDVCLLRDVCRFPL